MIAQRKSSRLRTVGYIILRGELASPAPSDHAEKVGSDHLAKEAAAVLTVEGTLALVAQSVLVAAPAADRT